jgi:hypothetical protein
MAQIDQHQRVWAHANFHQYPASARLCALNALRPVYWERSKLVRRANARPQSALAPKGATCHLGKGIASGQVTSGLVAPDWTDLVQLPFGLTSLCLGQFGGRSPGTPGSRGGMICLCHEHSDGFPLDLLLDRIPLSLGQVLLLQIMPLFTNAVEQHSIRVDLDHPDLIQVDNNSRPCFD